MLKLMKVAIPVGLVLLAFSAVQAEEVAKADKAACTGKECSTACSSCQQCPIAKAMDALPKLMYRVGEDSTTCPIEAGRMAQKSSKSVEYVVMKKVYDDEPKAFAAMVDMTEKYVADFAKPHKCDVSGKTLVAGKSLCCDVAAGEVAALVKKAMDGVQVTYMVGKQSVCCPDAAKAMAKKSGEKVVQMVAGKACGGCGTTTRLAVAHAKYKAAIEALLAADKTNEEKVAAAEDVKAS